MLCSLINRKTVSQVELSTFAINHSQRCEVREHVAGQENELENAIAAPLILSGMHSDCFPDIWQCSAWGVCL